MNRQTMQKFKQTEIGMIPEDWEFKELEKHAKIIMGQSPESRYYNLNGYGKLFLQGIKTFGHLYPNYDTWTTKVTKLAKKGSVLLSVRAPVGEVNFANQDVCIGRGLMSIDGENNKFIFYLFKGFKGYVVNKETGTVYGSVTHDDIAKLKFPFPPLPEQSAIAKILSDLDAKIELNQQMNKTLEEIGKAIFKHWFVDFEFPNDEGKPYKSSGGEMVFNKELGKEIPKGWKISNIAKDFNLVMGQSPPGFSYNEVGEGVVFFQGKTDFGNRFPKIRMFCTEPTRFAKKGDTLVSVRAPVGDVNFALQNCCIGRGLSAIRHKSGALSYTFYLMRNLKPIFESFEAEGTVFGSMSKEGFEQIKIICPTTEIVSMFENIIAPIDKKIEDNFKQILTLSSIRDSLLPKLMSGKIRVPIEEKP